MKRAEASEESRGRREQGLSTGFQEGKGIDTKMALQVTY